MTIQLDHTNNTIGTTSGQLLAGTALNYAATQTIASATTTDIGGATSNSIIISGTTTITALGTVAAGAERMVQFSGALTLTHNATSLILPAGANITTAAGDVAYFVSLGAGNWRCTGYQKANGQSLVGGVTKTVSDKTAAYTVVVADNGKTIRTTSGTGSITLPSSVSAGVGFNFTYINGTSGEITVIAAGTDTIMGSGSIVIAPGGTYSFMVSTASATGTWVVTSTATQTNNYAVSIGRGNASGVGAIAIGSGASSTVASGAYSMSIGTGSAASSSDISIGWSTSALGGSSVAFGTNAYASGNYSWALGYRTKATEYGKFSYASGLFSSDGDAQFGLIVLRAVTVGSVVALTANGSAISTTNQIIVATGQAKSFTGTLIGKQSGSANIAAYEIKGTVVNNAGTVTMPTGTLTLIGTDSIGLTTAPTIAADNTNKGVTLTGGAKTATNVNWVATILASEITFA